jgi:valyl-tRNA synthetase
MEDERIPLPDAPAEMASAYDAGATEARWYATWLERGYFHADPERGRREGREPFCIVLPPPNVTGSLHMGHAFQQLLQDIVVRRKRMQGYEALWLPGTDHAGIATQVVVERELAGEGIDRRELGREGFVERVWQWKDRYGGRIVEQMKAMGNSCDWDRLRFTMDEGLAHAVRVAFVRLYEDGLIYRRERIINWCPRDTTALSDSEVEHEDVPGELVTFRYEIVDPSRSGPFHVDVATTRVETMLGDTGIAMHPADERYANAIGLRVRHPFTGAELPIVSDEAVDPGFGTGAVKVTPAHDPMDFEIGQRHGMPLVNILTADAHISDAAPEEFRGLDRYEARARVLERLRELGLVVEEERPYVHSVGHCYRCHTEIEPWIFGKQWFVAVDRLKGPAKEAALDGRVHFWPERWTGAYTGWLDGLRDWNISRQLWWGHRIPVWYCPDGHQFASVEDPAACLECGSREIEQDPDVLDTWFSSQLWPFSTLGWPEETEDLAFFYPTSALITGYEILYLWVARMIMSGLRLAGQVPFRHAVIHGLIRDPQNRKMSKSLGNVIDPLTVIERAGADALRFGLTWQATEAQNIPFGEEHIDAGRRFANKIWNAARLVFRSYPGGAPALPPTDALTLPERWLLSRHQACLEAVDRALEEYRFADAAQAIHRFFWSELCDWALEVEKRRLYEGTEDERAGAANVLAWVLERSLRLLHPMMPFVTEEVWQRFGVGESIVIEPWPEPHPEHRDQGAEVSFRFVEELVTEVRRFRKAHGLPDGGAIPAVQMVSPSASQAAVLEALQPEIERLANVRSFNQGVEEGAGGARLVVQGTTVLIPLADLLDPYAERARLSRRLAAVEADVARSEGKLASDGFLAKAPAEVVDHERERLAALKEEAATLGTQLGELG